MEELKPIFDSIDQLFRSCDIDFDELNNSQFNERWFTSYENQRIVNSFLFNYIKIQDKIGAKLFKTLLLELKEINDFSVPMIDVLHILEKLNIIESVDDWDKLRELRNILAHEYPSDIDDRLENIAMALDGYKTLKSCFDKVKTYSLPRQNGVKNRKS